MGAPALAVHRYVQIVICMCIDMSIHLCGDLYAARLQGKCQTSGACYKRVCELVYRRM